MINAKSIDLPSTFEVIGTHAFRATGAESITIPDSVTKIGIDTFTMSQVKNVKLSSNMSEIPAGAFYQCNALESLEIPENITKIGNDAFANCTSLKSFTVPENIKEIGIYAFMYCDNLSEITIEASDCVIEDDDGLTLNNTDTIIHGHTDSTAYQYAEKNGYRLMSLEDGTLYDFRRVNGDANGDGKLNVRDVAAIAKYLATGR